MTLSGLRLYVFKMRKITAITPQARNPQRVNLYLDGEFAFGLTRIVAAWLQVGQTLTDEKIAALQAEDAREMAYVRALNYLSYRARSLDEIRQNLRKHEVPETVIEETLERLQRNGFASDSQFARDWVENRSTFRPRGRRLLALELRQKGIEEGTIREILDDGLDEADLAYQAGLKKARQLAHLDRQAFRRKMGDFLARRGFGYSDIAPVVSRLWDESRPEQTPLDDEELP